MIGQGGQLYSEVHYTTVHRKFMVCNLIRYSFAITVVQTANYTYDSTVDYSIITVPGVQLKLSFSIRCFQR